MNKVFFLLVVIVTLKPGELFSQEKFEREFTIKAAEVPKPALVFIDSIHTDSKVKWIKEQSQTSVSVEAKFKHLEKEYSVEFDTLGNLQDAEFNIQKETIDSKVLKKIESQLDSMYSLWKYAKIQTQYKGESDLVLSSIVKDTALKGVKISYEIVVQGKKDKDAALYQLTFDKKGKLYQTEKFVRDRADHLQY